MSFNSGEFYNTVKPGFSILRQLLLGKETLVEKMNQLCDSKLQICSQINCSCGANKTLNTPPGPSKDKIVLQSDIVLNSQTSFKAPMQYLDPHTATFFQDAMQSTVSGQTAISDQISQKSSHISRMDFLTQHAISADRERLQSIIDIERKYIKKLKDRKRKLACRFQRKIIEPLDVQINKIQSSILQKSEEISRLDK